MMKFKLWISRKIPDRTDLLKHIIIGLYVAIISLLTFFLLFPKIHYWNLLFSATTVVLGASFTEWLDKKTGKGTPEWEDFYWTSAAGLSVVLIAGIVLIINQLIYSS